MSRYRVSVEGRRVEQYKEAEYHAKASIDRARAAVVQGRIEDARWHLSAAREGGEIAEQLREESRHYYGPDGFDEGHERAIDWIHEMIFQRADNIERRLSRVRGENAGGRYQGRGHGDGYEGETRAGGGSSDDGCDSSGSSDEDSDDGSSDDGSSDEDSDDGSSDEDSDDYSEEDSDYYDSDDS